MASTDDQLEIRNIISRLALLADGGDLDVYVDLFTTDAVWDMPGAEPRKGHDEIRSGAVDRRSTGMTGPGSNTRHVITTTAVAVDGDEGHAESVFQFWHDTTTAPRVQLMGHYADTFERTPGGWKLAHRKITFG